MKILTISDKVEDSIYSSGVCERFRDVDLVLGCGDLPYYYLEFIVTMLGGPLFYVVGNHANAVKERYAAKQHMGFPDGCENIDGRTVRYRNLLIAGFEGSMRYNNSPHFQYTEREMAWKVWQMTPALIFNRLRYGRYLDILITHAPPQGIHDQEDRCHRGFRVFRTFMDRFRPRYLIHGHIHVYTNLDPRVTTYGNTQVINTYGHRFLEIDDDTLR